MSCNKRNNDGTCEILGCECLGCDTLSEDKELNEQ